MTTNLKFFKNKKFLPTDEFLSNVLYDKKIGYYSRKVPFGIDGDFITSPNVSDLFSEIIAIWIISVWEVYGKPKKINIVELGPGDGSLSKILLKIFERFPEFNCSKKMYLFEISNRLKNLQKNKITNKKVKWIKDFNKIKNGPVIFFGNEFFDAIPIQQFKKNKGKLYKKYFSIQKQGKIKEIFKKASKRETSNILNYKSLKNLKFIEFPKNGLKEIKRMIKKILQLKGCLLLIDYGYIKPNNQNTLQSVMRHKKNNFLKNLGNADITSHVNFKLLDEFFKKNKLKTKSIISQQKFLKKMGIIERAEIIAKKMKFKEQSNLYLRLSRLLNSNLMGEMFKVILAYKSESDNFFGFE